MSAKERLAKLEKNIIGEMVTVRLKGGGTAMLPSARLPDILHNVAAGRDTPETRIALTAASSNEAGQMIQLMQAIASPRSGVVQ